MPHRTGIHLTIGALAAIAAGIAVVASQDAAGHGVAIVLALTAATLAWIATRPLHPAIGPLYRARVQGAWEDWVQVLEREAQEDSPRAADERERATIGLLQRLVTTKPPASMRAEHDRRVAALAAYADALVACHAAQRAGDEAALAAASQRLNAARDALG